MHINNVGFPFADLCMGFKRNTSFPQSMDKDGNLCLTFVHLLELFVGEYMISIKYAHCIKKIDFKNHS